MSLSSVAGIVDAKGGFRVVVTEFDQMAYHVGKGERLFVVPGLFVKEPVAHNEISALIEKVERYVREVG